MSGFYIGLDVHQNTSTYCVLDRHGRHVRTVTVKGRWDRLVESLKQWAARGPIRVAFEASLGYGTLYDRLAPFCARVAIGHPGRMRMIFNTRRKNDRIDAGKIAKLLFLDELPEVHVPAVDVRDWRALVEFRTALIHKRTRCKNGVRAVLRGHGVAAPRSLWTNKGLAWLKTVELPTPRAALRRDILLDELTHLERQVKRVTKELDAMAKKHPGVALLMTIPGVGPRTAEAFVAYVDDPKRFAKTRRIGAYLGLVPSQDSSASVNRLGHVTKEGPPTLRRLLVEASWRAVDHDERLREVFDRIAAGKKEHRKVALVAVAHKLARIMLAMLRSGCVYERTQPGRETQLNVAA